MKNEKNVNEVNSKCSKFNDVNYGAGTSGTSKVNNSSEANEEAGTSFSNNNQETQTTENQTKCNSNNFANHISLTPEQIALEQILWVNKMYAIQMAEYWKS